MTGNSDKRRNFMKNPVREPEAAVIFLGRFFLPVQLGRRFC
jgi:hypothetical protein